MVSDRSVSKPVLMLTHTHTHTHTQRERERERERELQRRAQIDEPTHNHIHKPTGR